MPNDETQSGSGTRCGEGKTRVGLAIQGGVVPAGAFAAGVLKGLVKQGAFDRYDICAFSGTSAGAQVAAVCWGNNLQDTIQNIPDDLERQWMYFAWPNHFVWLPVWAPTWARGWLEVDALLMKFPMWRYFAENVRTPFMRWLMTRWIGEIIPIAQLNSIFDATYSKGERESRPGLVLGAADVLKGEIKAFREDELSLSALLASGSLDDFNGMTTIVTPSHAGTYLDGAWADNPPINELLDYRLDEIWLIQCFPKAIPALPRTPAERKERKDELWQNSLVEHEREFVEWVNKRVDLLNGAILAEIGRLQQAGELPGASPADPKLSQHLEKKYQAEGKLPEELDLLFDETKNFAPKTYKYVKVKRIEIAMPRELGSAIVNAPWFVRNLIDHGYERACDFAARNFGDKPPKPAGLRPGWWAWIPSPANDYLCAVRPPRPASDALDLVCDFCPKKAATTARRMLPDAFPQAVSRAVAKADQILSKNCPRRRVPSRWQPAC